MSDKSPINPKEYIDLSSRRYVPVIASFNVKGDCVPLYFRYIFADDSYTDIPLDELLKLTREHVGPFISVT